MARFYDLGYIIIVTMNCLRTFYIMAASLHAMISLVSVGYYVCYSHNHTYPTDTKSVAIIRVLNAYETIIGFLAVTQLVAHLGLLFPMRFFQQLADAFTTLIGGGDLVTGIKKYYKYIGICNICIFMMLAFGSTILGFVWSEDLVDINFYVLVLMTLLILFSVLVVRLVAICTGNVKQWFYLQWSVDASSI